MSGVDSVERSPSDGGDLVGARRLAVVTVTHGSEAHIGGLLRSLAASRPAPVAEVIVVDNGSTDATVAMVARCGDVPVLEQTNTGYAHGVNRGIAAVAHDLDVLVLNPDVVLDTASIVELVRVLDHRPSAGIVVPRLRDAAGGTSPSLRRDPSIGRTLMETLVGGRRAGRFGEAFRPDPAVGRQGADWATGAVMLLRRTMIDRIGPLDESFFLYSEETEYCQRARDAGFEVVCATAAVATHVGGDLAHDPRLWALRAVNRVRLYGRRHGPVAAVAFRTANVAFELRRLLGGHRVSVAALRALTRPDLDAAAHGLVRALGGDRQRGPTVGRAQRGHR